MGQREAEVELTFLEYIILSGSDRRWRFKTKPNPQFDQLIGDLIKVRLFQLREVYFTLGSGDYAKQRAYEIHDDGMWFLSHLFSNWREWYEKTKVSTLKDLPPCSRCGKACNTECAHCNKPYCETCYDLHQFNLHYQEQTNQAFRFHFEVSADDFINMNDFIRHAFERQTTQGTFTHTFTQAPTIPADVRDAHHLLGITQEKPTEAEIKAAFRAKVKQAATGNGNYQGDMDALTRAKERALQFAGVH